MTESKDALYVNAVTPDGSHVVADTRGRLGRSLENDRGGADDLIVVALDGDRAAGTLLGTELSERNATISPDGTWMAYESDRSEQSELYVQPFPDVEVGQR